MMLTARMSIPRVTLLTACVISLALAVESDWNQEARDLIVDIHNEYRRNEGGCRINKLVYDHSLEEQAKIWAEGCQFKHEMKEGRGENLAYDTSTGPEADLIKSSSKHWFDEKNDYSYGQANCDKSCHYTQMVWDDTTKIGCYTARCPTLQYAFTQDPAWYFVCFYTPMGNWFNKKPYEKVCDTPCNPGQVEEDGLCVDEGSETDEGEGENTGTEEGTETGENTVTDEGTETGENTGTDEGTETGENTGTDEGTETGENTGTDEGTETGENTGTDEGAETGENTGTDEGAETGENTGTDESAETGENTGTDESSGESTETEEGSKKTGGCSGSKKSDCEDDHPNCRAWAASDQCTENPGYMLIHCKKACKVCEGGDEDTSKPDVECKDDHTRCAEWAENDQCAKNPGYMWIHCKKTCGEC